MLHQGDPGKTMSLLTAHVLLSYWIFKTRHRHMLLAIHLQTSPTATNMHSQKVIISHQHLVCIYV